MLRTLVSASLLTLALAAPAASIPYNGLLLIEIGSLGPPLRLAASGIGTSEGLGGGLVIGAITGITRVTSFTRPAFPIVSMRLSGPAGIQSASFQPGGGPEGGLGGFAPLMGSAKIGLFGPPPFAFLTIPLGVVGAGGTETALNPPGITIRVSAAGWTTGQAKLFSGLRPSVTLASTVGSDLRTAGGLGSVSLVSPALATSNVAASQAFPIIARLELTFVPEPGTLSLLALGLAGLIGLGRRRRLD